MNWTALVFEGENYPQGEVLLCALEGVVILAQYLIGKWESGYKTDLAG